MGKCLGLCAALLLVCMVVYLQLLQNAGRGIDDQTMDARGAAMYVCVCVCACVCVCVCVSE